MRDTLSGRDPDLNKSRSTTMVMAVTSREAPTESAAARPDGAARDWRAEAVARSERSREASTAALRAELVGRLGDLTGLRVPAERVLVSDGRRALAWVDGVQFRLEGGELTIACACVHCGVNELESPPVRSRDDLDYVLAVWEPRCRQCPLEDPPEL
jgi:hypothetical protein